MSYMEVFNQIKQDRIGSLYLFYGEEDYVKAEALDQLKEKLLGPGLMDLNYHVLEGANVADSDIINASETLPLMADRRLLVIKNHPSLTSRGSSDSKELECYLARLPASTCLVFFTDGAIDKRKNLYKAIAKYGMVAEFHLLDRVDLRKWTSREFRNSNKQISKEDLDFFLDRAGNVLEHIRNELSKLVSYTGDKPLITREMIEQMVAPTAEYTVFQLIDAIAGRQEKQALKLLDKFLDNNANIHLIITMLYKQFRNMLLCKEYSSLGLTPNLIVDRLSAIDRRKVHPYVVKKCSQQARSFTTSQLKSAIRACSDLDQNSKAGKIEVRLGLELLIVRLCSQNMSLSS